MERELTVGELLYRQPMPVRERILYRSGDAYPLCPRCRVPINREHQRFCDRCGQKLDWADYRRARLVAGR